MDKPTTEQIAVARQRIVMSALTWMEWFKETHPEATINDAIVEATKQSVAESATANHLTEEEKEDFFK